MNYKARLENWGDLYIYIKEMIAENFGSTHSFQSYFFR